MLLGARCPDIREDTEIRPGNPDPDPRCYPGSRKALREYAPGRYIPRRMIPVSSRGEQVESLTNRKTRGTRVANIKSQIKRVKTNEKRRQRNKSVKSSVRTAIRRFREAVEAGDTEKITEQQRSAARALDKAATKGVIHRNQAANKKAAMARRVNAN
jgi:small subunit ribosomal protein S20